MGFISAVIVLQNYDSNGILADSIDEPLLLTVKQFVGLVDEIVVMVPALLLPYYTKRLSGLKGAVKITEGGNTFILSIANGLAIVDKQSEIVAVHDGVRPFVSKDEINGVIAAAKESPSIIGTRVTDTVKTAENGIILNTINRQHLWCLRSPFAADSALLKCSLNTLVENKYSCIDTAGLVALMKSLSIEIRVVEGKYENVVFRNK